MHFTSSKLWSILYLSLLSSQSAAQAISTTCDADCQNATTFAAAFERSAHAHTPLDDFYAIPARFNKHTKPGDLLAVEAHTDLTNYTVPSSLTMSRIMYASESLNGTVVPVSAFVLWPYAPYQYKPASSKYPMIAWAHGTSGLFPACAPSNYRSLQYHFMIHYPMAMEGFAIVATDYAGLGVTTLPGGVESLAYLSGYSGANDVAYSIEAARKAFPQQFGPQSPFVMMGHSEGGNVALAFAERQAKTPVSGYLGVVAMSPPTDAIKLAERTFQAIATMTPPFPSWIYTNLDLQPLLIAAVNTLFPAYNYSGLTDWSYDRWNNVLKPLQGCLPLFGQALPPTQIAQFARPGWTNNTYVQQWRNLTLVGAQPVKGPMLVTMGDNDVFPVDFVSDAVDKSCELSPGEDIEFQVYKGMQHFPAIQAGYMSRMSWIKDRFAGAPVRNGKCGKQMNYNGLDVNYTLQYETPNWLVDWVPSTLQWELAL